MTLEEIKEGLQTAGGQELLPVDEIINIVVNEMQKCKDSARTTLLATHLPLSYRIPEIQAKEARIFAYADFLEKIGVNEIYLAILKDEMVLANAERLLQITKRCKEREKGGEE